MPVTHKCNSQGLQARALGTPAVEEVRQDGMILRPARAADPNRCPRCGTVAIEWSQAQLDAQIDRERRRGCYWHNLLGSLTVDAYNALLISDPTKAAQCLAPIP